MYHDHTDCQKQQPGEMWPLKKPHRTITIGWSDQCYIIHIPYAITKRGKKANNKNKQNLSYSVYILELCEYFQPISQKTLSQKNKTFSFTL